MQWHGETVDSTYFNNSLKLIHGNTGTFKSNSIQVAINYLFFCMSKGKLEIGWWNSSQFIISSHPSTLVSNWVQKWSCLYYF